jgi:hypothetical protein
LRHEFDRIRLVSQLGKHASVDIARVKPRVVMTPEERERVADELARHCEETDVDGDSETVRLWRESVETMLGIPVARKSRPLETRAKGLRERFARFRRRRLDRGTSGERDPE